MEIELKRAVKLIEEAREILALIIEKKKPRSKITPDELVCDLFNESIKNRLNSVGIFTVGELLEKTPKELLEIRCLGAKSLRNIQDYLQENNLKLK